MGFETFNTVDDLIDKVGYPDDSVGDADLQDTLERAHRRLEAAYGRYVPHRHRWKRYDDNSDEFKNSVRLDMRPVYEVVEVQRFQRFDINTVIPESKYSVNFDDGDVVFDQGWVDDNVFTGREDIVLYVPKMMKDLELWMAVQQSVNQDLIELEDSEKISLEENAQRQIQRLGNMVNRAYTGSSVSDGVELRGTKWPVVGLDLNRAGKEKLQNALFREGLKFEAIWKKKVPVYRGQYKNRIVTEKLDDGLGVKVGTDVPYARFLEDPPSSMWFPPVDELKKWVRRVLNPDDVDSTTYLVGRKIEQEGIEPQPSLFPAIREYRRRNR